MKGDAVYGEQYDYSDGFDGDGREAQSGGGLRKQLEEALAEIRSLRQEVQGAKRETTVTDLLESKGIDPAVAQIIPADADPAGWLDQYGSLFNTGGKTLDEAEPPTPEVEDDPDLRAEQEAMQAMSGASTGTSTTQDEDPIAKLKSFQTQEELLAFLGEQGVEF